MTLPVPACKLPANDRLIEAMKEALEQKDFSFVKRMYYAGGTLCLDWDEEDEERLTLLNFSDKTLSDEVRYWMARIYVQYKSEKSAHYVEAENILKEFEHYGNATT